MAPPPELLLVMPVYNEQASVRKVVLEWFQEVENWTEDFIFLAIDDGSTDRSPQVLARLREQLGHRFEILRQENAGHGRTCMRGYSMAVERRIPYVFQLDSDGQCDPQYFFRFWRKREDFDVIYGERVRRDDGWRRVVASMVLKFVLLVFGRAWCVDANVPYRLMKTAAVASALPRIPPTFTLANVALAVLLRRDPAVRHASVPIHFRERYGGEPTVMVSQFGEKAIELIQDLRRLNTGATESGSADALGDEGDKKTSRVA